jgi:hypothetical protein
LTVTEIFISSPPRRDARTRPAARSDQHAGHVFLELDRAARVGDRVGELARRVGGGADRSSRLGLLSDAARFSAPATRTRVRTGRTDRDAGAAIVPSSPSVTCAAADAVAKSPTLRSIF